MRAGRFISCGTVRDGCLQVIDFAAVRFAGRFAGRCGTVVRKSLKSFAGRLRVGAGSFPHVLHTFPPRRRLPARRALDR